MLDVEYGENSSC